LFYYIHLIISSFYITGNISQFEFFVTYIHLLNGVEN
jgi:hypothetical protein